MFLIDFTNVDEVTRLAIEWGPTALFLLIFLVATIWGLIRGFRKSSILAIHALVALAICLTGYLIIVNNPNVDVMVVEYTNKILGEGGLQNQLGVSSSCKSLTDCLIEFIPKNMNYGDGLILVLQDNGAYLATLVNMAYHIVFALAFAIIYLVLLFILYLFVYHIFYPERRYKKKKMRKEAKLIEKGTGVAKPYKKRRLLGGLVGATRGLVAGLVCMSFLGAIFFVVAGGTGENSEKEDNTYTFGDDNLDMVYNVYQNISHYGETGIFKLLNSVKNKEQVPYYLFASELVFQGGSKEILDKSNRNTNIALTKELTAYTKFARQTFDLLLKHDSEFVIRGIIKNENPDADILTEVSKIMGKAEFQTEFDQIIEDFDANTYFINLSVSLIDSIAKNLNEFENLGLSEDVLEITGLLFDEDYKSPYVPADEKVEKRSVIKVSDLLSVKDTKSILSALVSTLGLNVAGKDNIEKILVYTDHIIPKIEEFSILSDSNKKTKFNPLLERVFTYSVNKFIPKEEGEENVDPTAYVQLLSEETTESLDWIDEIKNVLALASNTIKIGINVYKPNMDLQKDYLDLLFNIFDENDPKHVESEGYFTEVKNSLATSSLLSLVLSDTGMYKTIEKSIMDMAPEAYFDSSKVKYINYKDESGEHPGEIYNIITALETAVKNKESKQLLQSVLNNEIDTNDMNQVLELAEKGSKILTDGGDKSVLSSLLNSDIFSSVLSGMIIGMKEISPENNIVLYIPDYVLEAVDGKPVNLIKDDEIKQVLNTLPGLITIVKPYLDSTNTEAFNKITPLINRLAASDSFTQLLESNVIEGTLVNAIGGVLTQESLQGFVTMPDNYLDDNNLPNVEVWLQNKEISNMVMGIAGSGLDFDALLAEGADMQTAMLDQINLLAEKEINATEGEKPIENLLKSQLLHYSVSGMLLNQGLIDGFAFYVPETSLEEGNAKLIKTDEISQIFVSVPDVFKAVGPYLDKEDETYNKITPLINRLTQNDLLNEVLANNIVHGTMVNTVAQILTEPSMASMITMPYGYLNDDGTANVPVWINSHEISNIVYALSKSGLDLDALTDPNANQQETMLTQIRTLAEKEKNAPLDDKPVTTLLESQIMYYTLSGYFITEEGEPSLIEGIDIYVPEDSKESAKLVKKTEITNVIINIPDLLDAVNPYLEEGNADKGKITPLVNRLTTDGLVDNLLKSGIVHGTLVNTLGGVLTEPSMASIIVMPDGYIVDGKPDVELWMEKKEISLIMNGISKSGLDLDTLISPDGNQQEAMLNQLEILAEKEKNAPAAEKPVSILLESQIMHYTISGMIIPEEGKESLIQGVDIYVPEDSKESAKLIKKPEITNVIVNIPDLLKAVNPYLEEGNADKGKITPLVNRLTTDGLVDKLLKSGIVHGTLVNTLGGVLTEPSMAEIIVMPADYIVGGKPNVELWISNHEISSVINGISKSGLDLDVLMEDGTNKQDAMLEQMKKLSTTQKNAPDNDKPMATLLDSQIMHYTLSGLIMPQPGKDSLVDGINIYVPKAALDSKNDSLVSTDEITNVITALPALLNPIDKFMNPTTGGSINTLVNDLVSNDPELNVIPKDEVYTSLVLKYTLADKLTDELTKDSLATYITLPEGYIDINGNKVIDKWFDGGNEIDNLLTALTTSKLDIDAMTKEGFIISDPINTLSSLEENVLEAKIFGSAVIHSTVSGLIEKQASVNIIVPTASKITGTKLIVKNELAKLVKSVPIVLNNASDTNALVKAIIKDNNDNKENSMLQQPILLTTIVNYLNTNIFNSKDTPIVVTKDLKEDAAESKLLAFEKNGGNKWENEIPNLLTAFDVILGITTDKNANLNDSAWIQGAVISGLSTLNNIVDEKTETKLQMAYKSEIMVATLSNQLDTQIGQVINNSQDYLGVKVDGLYKQEEVAALVDAFNYLKIDFNNPSFEEIMLTNELMNKVNKSKIIKMALSVQLGNVNEIVIPKSDYVTLNKEKNIQILNDTAIDELLNILVKPDNKMALFGTKADKVNITKISLDGLTINLLNELITSSILHATTISKLGTMTLGITIPKDYKTAADHISENYLGNIWVTGEEVKKLITALGVFVSDSNTLITDINADIIKKKISKLTIIPENQSESDLTKVYKSVIIKATLTEQLNTILTPTIINQLIINQPTVKDSTTKYYLESEIANMVDALNGLNLDVANLDNAVTVKDKLLSDAADRVKLTATINNLAKSKIVWEIVSDQVNGVLATLELSSDVLAYVRNTFVIETTTFNQIKPQELINLLYGMNVLVPNISDFSNFDVSVVANSIFSLTDDKLQELEKSTILWYMLAKELDKVLDGKVSATVIKNSKENINGTTISVYKRSEVLGLINAVSALGVGDLNGFNIMSVDPSKVTGAYKCSNIIKDIITHELDKAIKNSNGVLKTYDTAYVAYELDNSVKFYTDTEIKSLLTFITEAGGDLGSFDISKLKLTKTSIGLAKESIIINATITSKIKDSFIMVKSAYQVEGKLLTNDELGNLLSALVSFGMDLGSPDVSKVSPQSFKSNISTISKSILMRTKLSSLIAEASLGKFLVSNDKAISEKLDVVGGSSIVVLTEAELTNFLNALISISGNETTKFELQIDYNVLLSKDANFIYSVCKSSIVMNFLSELIPNEAYTKSYPLLSDSIEIDAENGGKETYTLVTGDILEFPPINGLPVPSKQGYKLHAEVASPAYNLSTGVLASDHMAKTAKDIVALIAILNILK